MAGNKIYIQVDFQSTGAAGAIDALNQKIKSVGPTSQASTKQAETGFNSLSVSIAQTTRGLDQIGQSLAGLGLARAFVGMVQANDDIKKTTIAFQAMGASALEARDAVEAVRIVAKTSPFSFDDLREMAQRLRGFGFDLKQIPVLLNTIANAAAALGKGKIAIDSITLALGQMKAKGIIQGQEAFRQLAEQGINSVKYLQKAIQEETGKIVSELDVRKMIEKQMIGAEKGVQVILDGMTAEFGGAGEKMAKELQTAQFDKSVDDMKKLGAAIEEDFAPAVTKAINNLRELVSWFGQLPKWIQNVTVEIGLLVIAMTTLGAVSKLGLLSWLPAATSMLGNLTKAFGTLRLAVQVLFTDFSVAAFTSRLALISTMTPAVVNLAIAVGSVAAAYAGWKAGEWMREKVDPDSWLGRLLNRDVEVKDKKFGEGARADMELLAKTYQKWMVDAKLPEAAKMSIIPFNKQTTVELQDSIRTMRMLLDADAVATKARSAKLIQESKDAAKHQEEIANQTLERAKARLHGPIFGLNDKYAGELREMAGATKEQLGKVYEAIAIDLELAVKQVAEENIKLMEEANKTRLEGAKALQEYFEDFAKFPTERFKRHLEYVAESDKMEKETLRSRLEFESTALAADRDQKLAEADVVHRQTLQQEIDYQQTVFAIKQEYAERIRDVERQLADQKYEEELASIEVLHGLKLMSDMDYLIRSSALWAANEERKKQITVKADIDISKDRLDAAKATNTAIINEQKQIYDKLKSSLSSVFDALLNKSTSVWAAIGNSLKVAIIGAIKEIVTSRAAAALMQMFGYGTVSFGGGARGLGGQQPTFGGGVSGAVGTGGILASLFGVGRASGSTATAPAAVATYGAYSGGYSPAAAAGGGGASQASGMAGLSAGMAGLLGIGNIAKFGGGAFGTAAGLASSPAAGIAGAMLAMSGLKRGGILGLGMTAGGGLLTGAAIGMLLGGPLGAIMGGFAGLVIGGIAGTIRLFIKTADDKLRVKLRQVYGIDVHDKGLRAQILEMAKSKYGGNLDMAVRAPETQELIKLYSLATGQTPSGIPRPMYGASFAQSGGGFALQPVYNNGQLVASPYSGSTTPQYSQGVYVQLNPQQANDLFEGKVVNVIETNPSSVGQASARSSRSGNSRDAQRMALMEPLTVVR